MVPPATGIRAYLHKYGYVFVLVVPFDRMKRRSQEQPSSTSKATPGRSESKPEQTVSQSASLAPTTWMGNQLFYK